MQEETRYIQILRESLSKKERLLHNLLEITKQQSDYINGKEFDIDVFNDLMDVKEEMIQELNAVEDAFESLYDRIRVYLMEHKETLANEIVEMQNRIREITNLSVSIQALEERNKQRLEVIFNSKRQEINNLKKSTRMVNNYYNAMTGSGVDKSMYFNKKK